MGAEARRIITVSWSVLGVVALLAEPAVRLGAAVVRRLQQGLGVWESASVVAAVLVLGYVEGYRGFRCSFGPRVVERAFESRGGPECRVRAPRAASCDVPPRRHTRAGHAGVGSRRADPDNGRGGTALASRRAMQRRRGGRGLASVGRGRDPATLRDAPCERVLRTAGHGAVPTRRSAASVRREPSPSPGELGDAAIHDAGTGESGGIEVTVLIGRRRDTQGRHGRPSSSAAAGGRA